MRTAWPASAALLALVVASAVAVVLHKHQSRRAFIELQRLEDQRDRLQVQWSRLRLEQGAWSTHGRVERLARERLDMVAPESEAVVIRLDGRTERNGE